MRPRADRRLAVGELEAGKDGVGCCIAGDAGADIAEGLVLGAIVVSHALVGAGLRAGPGSHTRAALVANFDAIRVIVDEGVLAARAVALVGRTLGDAAVGVLAASRPRTVGVAGSSSAQVRSPRAW